MSGTLFVVATPIGNLEDVTLRALRVLGSVTLIAAEDTRRTARLLARHGLSTPTTSFHTHNVRARLPGLVAKLLSGADLALVTDAGTPGVSDPGPELVRAALEAGVRVEPIPGASAPLAAVVASGFPVVPLTIFGFPPRRSKDRTVFFNGVSSTDHTAVFFESPLRMKRTLEEVAKLFGNRPIILGREMTKSHEEFLAGTAEQLAARLDPSPRGEFTVVVGPRARRDADNGSVATEWPPDEVVVAEFIGLSANNDHPSRRSVVNAVARKLGMPAKKVYEAVERTRRSVE
jgi:16S rRNA (cytidine1402-2'-O)-methyltransferase